MFLLIFFPDFLDSISVQILNTRCFNNLRRPVGVGIVNLADVIGVISQVRFMATYSNIGYFFKLGRFCHCRWNTKQDNMFTLIVELKYLKTDF